MFNFKLIPIVIIALLPLTVQALNFDPPLNEGIQFPETHVDEESIVEMTISEANNDAGSRVTFNAPGNDVFGIDPLQVQVNANQEVVVEFSFTPVEGGEVSEEVVGSYSDGMRIVRFTIELRGVGSEGDPSITVEPVAISLELNEPYQHDEAAVIIGNIGEDQLTFEIESDIAWLQIEPMNGEVDVEAQSEITFSTTDCIPVRGQYAAEITIYSDDPENEEVIISVELNVGFDPNLIIDPNEVAVAIETNTSIEINLEAYNQGDNNLSYTIERRLVGDANADPWELRSSVNASEIVEDEMLNGVVFVDGYFYVSGSFDGDDLNKIYKINTDGENVGEFNQFAEDRYGMRDLAFDGELIWSAVSGTFYGFTTEGELVVSFESPVEILEGRSITWDPDNELLWTSDISTDIYGINTEGELVRTVENDDLRIYGLAYWSENPDGYNLYIFERGPESVGITVSVLDLNNGDCMAVTDLDIGDSRPSGMYITNQLDVYCWVIVALVQNPDLLNVWQLAANSGWFSIEPIEGVIEADETREFTLILDATGLPEDTFQGELVFQISDAGGQLIIPVELNVVEGRVQTTRDINLHIGWNTISANLQPNDNENVEGLVVDIVENGSMIMMKNGNGDFYRPEYEFNNIRIWNSWEGFQMLMGAAATLTLEGESVLRQDPIDLTQGWQLVSYYPRYEIEAIEALATIADNLIIAKDGNGNFYLPAWDDFSNMGNMCEGQGYYINVNADCRLIYVPEEEEERNASVSHCKSIYEAPGQLPVHAVTNENMSLLITSEVSLEGEVGVYASGELVGSGILQDGVCGIAVWGDDLSTDLIDGAVSDATLEIRMLTDNGLQDASYTILSGKLTYDTNGLAIIRLNGASELPLEFGIVSAYPNPFNSQMRVSYSLLETGIVDLAAYDVSGRRIAELSSGRQSAGIHTTLLDGSDMSSGVYILHLKSGDESSQMKVMLVK